VRVLVYALPIVLSLGFVRLAIWWVAAPTGTLWMYLVWWLAVSLAATGVVWLVFRLTRRLLPLGALLELSLVFPDAAPSRFSVARRTRTVASLEERTRLLREAGQAPTTQEAAETLLGLVAALDEHDRITAGHGERVRAYSAALGRELALSDDELDRLNWAALLHDVGKLQVSPEILNKPGAPNDEERESLQLHPLFGEALVAPLREWLGEWIDAVWLKMRSHGRGGSSRSPTPTTSSPQCAPTRSRRVRARPVRSSSGARVRTSIRPSSERSSGCHSAGCGSSSDRSPGSRMRRFSPHAFL
jgi:hypothetical protein